MSLLQKKVLFFGSDLITLNTLKTIRPQVPHLSLVLPPFAKPRTPLAELHQFAEKQNIQKFYQISYEEQWFELEYHLKKHQQDIGIVASFGLMIPDIIIDQFQYGILVMHPSLLPKYRGPCPIQHAILNQEKKTGVSIIEISKRIFDAGAISYQSEVEIGEYTTYKDLSLSLSQLGGEGIIEMLSDFEVYKKNRIIQDNKQVSKAPMIKNQFGHLKVTKLTADQIQTRFNALYGSNTKPRCVIKHGFTEKLIDSPAYFDQLIRVKFDQDYEKSILLDELAELRVIPAGIVHWNLKKDRERIYIKCSGGKQDWVSFKEITLSGIGKIKAQDLIIKYLQKTQYKQQHNPQFLHTFE